MTPLTCCIDRDDREGSAGAEHYDEETRKGKLLLLLRGWYLKEVYSSGISFWIGQIHCWRYLLMGFEMGITIQREFASPLNSYY